MNKPLVVGLPHSLGAEEATRRVRRAIEIAQTQYAGIITISNVEWSQAGVDFVASALTQSINGSLSIREDYVELTATLPLLLRVFAERIRSTLNSTGVKLLK